MDTKHIQIISDETGKQKHYINNILELFAGGSGIPFVSRYRKEATGSADEEVLETVKSRYEELLKIESRRETILESIEEQGKLTPELRKQITATYKLTELEDLYLPYKKKRKTKADKAREMGLEPLSEFILSERPGNLKKAADRYLNEKVKSVQEAVEGAKHIIAEQINEDVQTRESVRRYFKR
ncbi:MAG: Tex-like N-terminal domain-containing protein, partial [Bacteroidota bacterium]|nr:Tex-like N-terminal domain-containing protein [Bacteroidota bacterium]